ncbi:MAG: DUF429 domain-containing protein [Candidatus Eremiobacteraeota bacterium]|nr:DUF429 domain-containing protein [Candidatus Eremiobacteraeota bacterium]
MALDEPLRLVLCANFAEVAQLTETCRRVAVDMPVGLPGPGQSRDCEPAARRLLGPRRHSVFTTPPRRYLKARDFSEVQGMSLQSFHLLPKIRELDHWMTPARQARVFEAHPELVFTRLAGGPLQHSKKTPEGRNLREKLLAQTLPSRWPRTSVQPDDVLDALALLRCAQAPGTPLCFQQRDEHGLLMQIYGC